MSRLIRLSQQHADVSSVLSGFVADRYTLRKARKNHGISEAEHKLDLFIVSGICTPIGLLMMGLGPYYEAHWMVYVTGAFILNVAGPLASTLSVAYLFDCFHSLKPTHNGIVQAKVQGCAPYIVSNIFITMCFSFGFVSRFPPSPLGPLSPRPAVPTSTSVSPSLWPFARPVLTTELRHHSLGIRLGVEELCNLLILYSCSIQCFSPSPHRLGQIPAKMVQGILRKDHQLLAGSLSFPFTFIQLSRM